MRKRNEWWSAAERGRRLTRSEPIVSVVGASGLVGSVLLEVLEERGFPVGELRCLASARSPGREIVFRGRSVPVEPLAVERLVGSDLVFFAATGGLSRELAPVAIEAGAIVVDKSSTWRLHPAVPLVVPEVDPGSILDHRGLLACPNCTTIALVSVLEPLRRAAGLRRVVVTSLQAASGAGRAGLDVLRAELSGGSDERGEVFPARLAGNLIPLCGALGDDGSTAEETKLLRETRKILSLPDLEVAATCVRAPVEIGHALSLLVETERAISTREAAELLLAFPGVRIEGPEGAPTPLEVAGTDEVRVGRLRALSGRPGVLLWGVADNLRRGAASNAVAIAERLLV